MKAAYFDIDGTILIWPPPNTGVNQPGQMPTVNKEIVKAILRHKSNGDYIVIWSANPASIDYLNTHHSVIAEVADAIQLKPHILYDDNKEWLNKRVWRIV